MQPQPKILIARRDPDGLVYLGALVAPEARLCLLRSQDVEIAEHHTTRSTPHARRIVDDLKKRFARSSYGMEFAGPWFVEEYPNMLAAVGEYDLATGERISCERVKLHETVMVDGVGPGVVTGFHVSGRIEVTSKRYPRGMFVTLAPAASVRALA
jgi:hypothetical protein